MKAVICWARGTTGVEVVVGREQRFSGGHRVSLNGPDGKMLSPERDDVINHGGSVAQLVIDS